ncbi:MAG TPA: glycosyltransferase family 2 protein [Longimicrobiaceae bacterium]
MHTTPTKSHPHPSLAELPAPPKGKTGWPWTEQSEPLPETLPGGKPWPRISVVTPSYNQARFLEETIRSVLLQGYPNLEYFVMDGGSKDGSQDIIRKYEPWLTGWVSERDRGQSHAINKGWSRSTGEIRAWLNSDDVYQPDALRAAVLALERYPDAAAVFSDCNYVDAEGRLLVRRVPGEVDLLRLLRSLVSWVPQPTSFIRASVLEEVGLLDEEAHFSMDYDLWLRVSLKHRLQYVNGVWAATRMHEDAKTVALHRQVWENKGTVLYRILASPELPAAIRAEADALFSSYYLKLGCVYLQDGSTREALGYFARAVLRHPPALLQWRTWREPIRSAGKLVRRGPRQQYWPASPDA